MFVYRDALVSEVVIDAVLAIVIKKYLRKKNLRCNGEHRPQSYSSGLWDSNKELINKGPIACTFKGIDVHMLVLFIRDISIGA